MALAELRFTIITAVSLVVGVVPFVGEAQVSQSSPISSYAIVSGDRTVPIEPTMGKVEMKSSGALRMATGSFKSKQFVRILGRQATIRIGRSDPQHFVMTTSFQLPKDAGATTYVTLVNLRPLLLDKENNRQYVINDTHVNVIRGKMDAPGGIYGIHINVTKVSGNKMEFEPIERLAPGEYAFVVSDTSPYGEVTMRMYCFGVD